MSAIEKNLARSVDKGRMEATDRDAARLRRAGVQAVRVRLLGEETDVVLTVRAATTDLMPIWVRLRSAGLPLLVPLGLATLS